MAIFDKILNSRFVDQYGAALAPSFNFVNSSAAADFYLPDSPEAVSATIQEVISQLGHKLAGESEDRLQLAVITKKTWLSWEIATGIEIKPNPQGAHVSIYMSNMPGRPTALLDGAKNKKAAQKLADQIRAAM